MRDNADQLKQSLAALRESEERRRLFMDSAPEAFLLYDSELNRIDVNATTIEALGWKKKENVTGRNLVDLFPDAATSGRLEKYRKVLETGEPVEMDVCALGHKRDTAIGKHLLEIACF